MRIFGGLKEGNIAEHDVFLTPEIVTYIKEVLEVGSADLGDSVPPAERSERVRDCRLSGGEGELKESGQS